MSVLLEGETKIQDETASWSGMWQFAKDKKAGVSFDYHVRNFFSLVRFDLKTTCFTVIFIHYYYL
jgi:hypothetical protein